MELTRWLKAEFEPWEKGRVDRIKKLVSMNFEEPFGGLFKAMLDYSELGYFFYTSNINDLIKKLNDLKMKDKVDSSSCLSGRDIAQMKKLSIIHRACIFGIIKDHLKIVNPINNFLKSIHPLLASQYCLDPSIPMD